LVHREAHFFEFYLCCQWFSQYRSSAALCKTALERKQSLAPTESLQPLEDGVFLAMQSCDWAKTLL